MDAAIAIATVVITGLFAVIGILLKQVLDTKKALQPISNGFAAHTSNSLETIETQVQEVKETLEGVDEKVEQNRTDVAELKSDVRDLQSADDTLLELMTEVKEQRNDE